MNTVLIGNTISLVGCTLMVAIGFLRKKEHIIIAQCFQFGLQGVANLTLGAVTGSISCLVSIIRNLCFFRLTSTLSLKLIFTLLLLLLSSPGFGSNPIEWIPFLCASLLTWFLDVKKEALLKTVIIIAQTMWLYYDFFYSNFVSMIFGGFTILANLIGIFLVFRSGKPG